MKKRVRQNGNTDKRTFAALYHGVPWEALSPAAKIIYVGICRRYNGSNNGKIHYGYRDAYAQCRCSTKTALTAFAELQSMGLISLARKGQFRGENSFNSASEWTISAYPLQPEKKRSPRSQERTASVFPGTH
ncbi:MAG: hypothetical protein R3D62_15000 [Xanthobacteraceae bacterium]